MMLGDRRGVDGAMLADILPRLEAIIVNPPERPEEENADGDA